jgi:hypothetical protein
MDGRSQIPRLDAAVTTAIERGRKLHITAGEGEVERPERVLAAPVDKIVVLREQNVLPYGLLDDVVVVVIDAGWLWRATSGGIDPGRRSCGRLRGSR